MTHTRLTLAKRISIGILLGMVLVFAIAIRYIVTESKEMVRKEAYGRAERTLDNTCRRLTAYLDEAEVATNNIYWMVLANMQPDSLLEYTRMILQQNPNINSCSITAEPDYFPQYGHLFSASSVREGDSIITVWDTEYEYTNKVWYKRPRDYKTAVWIDPSDDFDDGKLSSADMIASYCVPLFDNDEKFIGVISTDIALSVITNAINAEKPYPNSYALMLGRDGHYFVHPETERLLSTTIFDNVDPTRQPALITLGHEMLSGGKGTLDVTANGDTYTCFYTPVPQAGWSIAIVCTEDDIFADYNHLVYIIVPLLAVGLILIILYSSRTVKRFIAPLSKLSDQARRIAEGHYDERMERTERTDVVGRLQNNFAAMQDSLNEHIGKLHEINAENEKRNAELALANKQAEEATRQKMAFLQDMSHQIRTPLNIIMGFAQVLRDHSSMVHGEEIHNITDTMLKNAITVNRMTNMLVGAAALAGKHEKAERHDVVNVNELAKTAVATFNDSMPGLIPLIIDSNVDTRLTIVTNRDLLTKALNEILHNAKKFTEKGTITLRLRKGARTMRFIVEDTGRGIPKESQDRIFKHFQKLDDFSEGLGLGLSISRQFAQMLGGDLYLDPDYTGGSRFVLEVPL